MCRHLAYVGPEVPVHRPVVSGEHSLRSQAWAPRDMRGGGTINADGFGVAWWAEDGTAVRYRNAAPIWTDPAVDEVLSRLTSRAVLAAVRSATVGTPVAREACAPFTAERFAFSHNGVVPGWQRLLPCEPAELDTLTDSAALWAGVQAALAADPYVPSDPGAAVASVVASLAARCPQARLNLLLSDGATVWATTLYHSLWVRTAENAVWVASEPVDASQDWRPIPDHSLVTARPGGVTIESF